MTAVAGREIQVRMTISEIACLKHKSPMVGVVEFLVDYEKRTKRKEWAELILKG